ncbi:MAG: hypothetical protein E6G10_16960 [Actinobacteria bacterium]|nr:MAG: hypothetical protein E6G10_16960 [Actinomycetota bacterium]
MAGALGTTGLAVSRIGLGLAALGRPGYIVLGHGSLSVRTRSPTGRRAPRSPGIDPFSSSGSSSPSPANPPPA